MLVIAFVFGFVEPDAVAPEAAFVSETSVGNGGITTCDSGFTRNATCTS